MITVNTNSAIKDFKRYDKKVDSKVMQVLDNTALMVETRAKRKLRTDGHIITGNLFSSIHVIKKGDDIPVKLTKYERGVGSNVVYAAYIEYEHDSYLHWANMKERKRFIADIKKATQ